MLFCMLAHKFSFQGFRTRNRAPQAPKRGHHRPHTPPAASRRTRPSQSTQATYQDSQDAKTLQGPCQPQNRAIRLKGGAASHKRGRIGRQSATASDRPRQARSQRQPHSKASPQPAVNSQQGDPATNGNPPPFQATGRLPQKDGGCEAHLLFGNAVMRRPASSA